MGLVALHFQARLARSLTWAYIIGGRWLAGTVLAGWTFERCFAVRGLAIYWHLQKHGEITGQIET